MSFDLTNKNISDTYQNVLQKTGSNNQLYDLAGNPVQNLTIKGALIAESYIVSQSTTVFSSGSTAFGNSSDDTHNFIGSVNTTSHITASGDISASNILGNFIVSNGIMIGQHNGTTTFLAADTKPTEIQGTNIELDAPVTASGDISASGIVFGSDIKSNGTSVVKSITDLSDNTTNQGKIQFTNTANVSVVKNISNLGSGDNPTFNNITASGDIFKTKLVQMTNSSSVIDTFNTGSFRSAKYVLQVISASNFQVSEMLVLHHNSTASNTEYAQINSGLNLINFTTDISNSDVRLNAAGSSISCSVRLDRTIIPS